METAALWLELATAVLFVLLLVRIGYVLASNPIGELTQELIYLRTGDLRVPALFLALGLLLEMTEFVFPFIARRGWLANAPDYVFYLNAVQALLILAAMVLIFIVVQRYTHRGLDRRIRDAMETLAYLAGQRRRRRGLRAADEEPARKFE